MNDASCPPAQQEAPCPVCGNAHAAFAFPAYGYDLNRYDLFRCPTCALVFVSPFPSAETLEAFYRTNYRQASASFYPKASSRRRRAVWRSLAFLPQVVGKDVLEIGCGGGFMVETFKRLGARVIGLDISQNSIDYARAHFGHCTFYCETMQAFRQRGLQFDFVFTSEVMEHLPGPADFMQTLEAVVRPGGFVYASAPDYSHQRTPWTLSSGTPCARPSTCCFSVPIPSSGCLPITALPFTGILAAKPRPIRCCSDGLPDPCA